MHEASARIRSFFYTFTQSLATGSGLHNGPMTILQASLSMRVTSRSPAEVTLPGESLAGPDSHKLLPVHGSGKRVLQIFPVMPYLLPLAQDTAAGSSHSLPHGLLRERERESRQELLSMLEAKGTGKGNLK